MATVNSSGEYTLTRGYLVNVNIDWPGYHDEEKTNVRRFEFSFIFKVVYPVIITLLLCMFQKPGVSAF